MVTQINTYFDDKDVAEIIAIKKEKRLSWREFLLEVFSVYVKHIKEEKH